MKNHEHTGHNDFNVKVEIHYLEEHNRDFTSKVVCDHTLCGERTEDTGEVSITHDRVRIESKTGKQKQEL